MASSKKSTGTEFSSVSKSQLASLASKEKWAVPTAELQFLDKGEIPFARGSGGKLFRAKWRGLVCAVKTIHLEEGANEKEHEEVIVDLQNEIALLSSLRHPHLVMFLGASLEDDLKPLLIMEYCANGTLENFLIVKSAKEQKVKLQMKLQIARELALGMTFLHQCSPPIVHRDLKPSNILLTEDNHVKITDFGLAKFFPGSFEEAYKMTGETGSYRFMAPEVFKHEEYDEKVDVYSYAQIIYWVMSLVKPFEHIQDALAAVTFAAVDGVRPPITHVKNKPMSGLITDCWKQKASERPGFETVLERVQTIENEAAKKGKWFRG